MSEGSVHQTLQNIEQITNDLKSSSNDLRLLTHNKIPSIVAKVDTTISDFAAVANEVSQVDVTAVVDNLNTVVQDIKVLLASQDGTLGLLLNDKALYDNLNTALKDLDNVVLNVDSVVTSIKARPFIQKKLPK
jgi:phospholipid/cholesterol/gamma-HCH transport system substrate-binding protein